MFEMLLLAGLAIFALVAVPLLLVGFLVKAVLFVVLLPFRILGAVFGAVAGLVGAVLGLAAGLAGLVALALAGALGVVGVLLAPVLVLAGVVWLVVRVFRSARPAAAA